MVGDRSSIGSEGTTRSALPPVSLETEEERLSVHDLDRLNDQRLRRWMVFGFVGTIVASDLLTLAGIVWLSRLDQANIERTLITPADRIITNQVIMTLLGATTVQVGTIAAIIARYPFPGRPRDE